MNMHAASGLFTHGVSNVGVSLRAWRGSTQVMLGCHCGPDGTRAIWDTSLVFLTIVDMLAVYRNRYNLLCVKSM